MNVIPVSAVKHVTMRCPDCLNYMSANRDEKGHLQGTCPVCKARVYSKQHSVDVRYIKIVRRPS